MDFGSKYPELIPYRPAPENLSPRATQTDRRLPCQKAYQENDPTLGNQRKYEDHGSELQQVHGNGSNVHFPCLECQLIFSSRLLLDNAYNHGTPTIKVSHANPVPSRAPASTSPG